jgi:hypothetical protein
MAPQVAHTVMEAGVVGVAEVQQEVVVVVVV